MNSLTVPDRQTFALRRGDPESTDVPAPSLETVGTREGEV